MSQALYIFDMDDTLIDGDTSMLWNQFLVEKGIATDPDFLKKDRELMALYADGKLDMEEYLEYTLAPILTLSTSVVNKLVQEYIDTKVMDRVFPQAKDLLDNLKCSQTPVVIISATVSFIVHAVAQRLGISEALGIDMQIKDDKYTAQIEGIPTYREGKVQRLTQWLDGSDVTFDETHFFTDSINDLPLCQHSDYAYLINPDRHLEKWAETPNWTTLHWTRAQ